MTKTSKTVHREFDFTHEGNKMFVDCMASTDWTSEDKTFDYPGSLGYETHIDKLNKFIMYTKFGQELIVITDLKNLPDEFYEIITEHIGAIHED